MYKRFIKKLTDASISRKMMIVYTCFTSIFLLISLALQQVSFYTYSDDLYEKSVQELDYFSQNVNRELNYAENANYTVSMDTLVQQNLAEMSKMDYPSIEYNQMIKEMRSILINAYNPESCVKSIIFIDLHGNKIEAGTSPWKISEESMQNIQAAASEANGACIAYGPTEQCPFLVYGRVVRNRLDMSLDNMGTLLYVCDIGGIIQKNKDRLSSKQAAVYVYSDECTVYSDEQVQPLDNIYTQKKENGYKIISRKNKKYFVSYLYSSKREWTYIDVFPYNDIYGQVQSVRYLLFIGFMLVFIMLVIIMKKTARLITDPLEKLTQSMQIVEEGDFVAAREILEVTSRNDEIGILSREFHAMLDAVDTLIKENYEKQLLIKDTKYKMLRAQINPHFLYNTLNVIHWMIKAGRNEEAGRMIVELGAILHYSFARKPYATIKDEVEMVRSYISIQMMRYQGRIEFTVETEGDIDNYITPRMILQPLVENSINYGAEPYLDICYITVRVTAEQDYIRMIVEDTGAGMNSEELEMVRRLDFVPKGHGIGLKNIIERLKMDDEESSFSIDSEPGKGTKVTIKIHKRTGEENDV